MTHSPGEEQGDEREPTPPHYHGRSICAGEHCTGHDGLVDMRFGAPDPRPDMHAAYLGRCIEADEAEIDRLHAALTTERHRTQVVEGERDEQKRINEFDIGVANAELREDLERVERERDTRVHALERLREALRQMIRVTELPGTRSELAPETERAKSAARSALAASQEAT